MSCCQNFFQLVFCFKFFVVYLMLLIEQRLFCLKVPLGDLGQLKGLLAPKQMCSQVQHCISQPKVSP